MSIVITPPKIAAQSMYCDSRLTICGGRELSCGIIAISGEYEAGALHGAPVQFLAKPFNLDVLLDMLSGKPN